MGYRGQTYTIPCDKGGLTGNKNIDLLSPQSMLPPTRNINLVRGGREKRGGTSHVNSTAFSGTPRIMGLCDYSKINGSQFLVVATADGKIYKNDTTTIKTGLGTTKYTTFEQFQNSLYISNGYDRPQTWDGSAASTSNITNIPTDWTGTNFPKQIINHGVGNSSRLWALGCPSNPYTLYISALDTDNFSDAQVTLMDIDTGDVHGIVGAAEFGDRLFCFGKRKSFVIDDSDASAANWSYDAAQFVGGVAHSRLIVKTPNDLVCMMEDGEIYSVTAVQSYGDYVAASLTRPSLMHDWIVENINLDKIDQFHAQYDPELRAIKFFVVRAGMTTIDTALVYFIDRPTEDAWVVHDNQSNASGYSASASCIYRKDPAAHHRLYVYTGDYSGFVWELEETNRNDNNAAFYAGWKTPHMTIDNPRAHKHFKRGWMITEVQGNYNLYINWWLDGAPQTQRSISLAGTGGVLDSFVLDTDVLGGNELIEKPFDLGMTGRRIQFEVFNSSVNEDFFVSSLAIDNTLLGARPS